MSVEHDPEYLTKPKMHKASGDYLMIFRSSERVVLAVYILMLFVDYGGSFKHYKLPQKFKRKT